MATMLTYLLLGLACLSSSALGQLTPVVLINAGSTVAYEDVNGNIWGADTNTDGRTPTTDPAAEIANTEDDALYRQFRDKLSSQGSLFYDIPVPSGTYVVELHFAELVRRFTGQRVFDIIVEGSSAVEDLDVLLQAGGTFSATVETVENVVVTDGVLNLEFLPVTHHAMVSAIGIYSATQGPSTAPPTETPVPTPAGGVTPIVLINAGSTVAYEDAEGNIWDADPNTDGRTPATDPNAEIADTEDDGLYQQFRDKKAIDGSLFYNIPVPNGVYSVELHFAELVRRLSGQRVFDIIVEGSLRIDAYDAILEAGRTFAADIQTFENVVVTDGEVNIEFFPINHNAMVSAIGIYRSNGPMGTPAPTVAPPLTSAEPSLLPTIAQDTATPTSEPSISDVPSMLPTTAPGTSAPTVTWGGGNETDYQPRVITVETYPPAFAQAFIGFPGGSIWCQGRPTYWWSAHDNRPEEPFCQHPNGTWTKSSTAQLNMQDALNIIDGPARGIDRHGCIAFDANWDGIDDIICIVGANSGRGNGFTELYYTQADGTIVRELDDVGFYKYATMRTRFIRKLAAADGGRMVVIATTGGPRPDGQSNTHRMFRLNSTNGFDEVMGPFIADFWASCLEVCDMNNDGIDDIIICDRRGRSNGYIQNMDGTWTQVDWSGVAYDSLQEWNGARVADVTGDGLGDLILAGPSYSWLNRNPDPYLRVYPGVAGLDTIFDFDNPVIDDTMPFETTDVEVIDVNEDGLLDIYVVLWNHTVGRGGYCQQQWEYEDWGSGLQLLPPGDPAPDYLYLSIDGSSWNPILMEHSVPGCGSNVRKWGEKSLAVSHGAFDRPGDNVILEWS